MAMKHLRLPQGCCGPRRPDRAEHRRGASNPPETPANGLGVSAELADIPLGQAQVFHQPPGRMRQAGWFGAAKRDGQDGDGA
jgi:hypothetical protein